MLNEVADKFRLMQANIKLFMSLVTSLGDVKSFHVFLCVDTVTWVYPSEHSSLFGPYLTCFTLLQTSLC